MQQERQLLNSSLPSGRFNVLALRGSEAEGKVHEVQVGLVCMAKLKAFVSVKAFVRDIDLF